MLIYSEAITKEQQDKDSKALYSTSDIKFLYVGIIMWVFFNKNQKGEGTYFRFDFSGKK